MAYDKNKVQKFDRINKSKLKNGHKRTRTGAYKTKTRSKGHGNMHKH